MSKKLRSVSIAAAGLACVAAAPAGAATWSAPQVLTTTSEPIGSTVESVALATDASGTTTAAWAGSNTPDGARWVMAATRPRGGTWSTPERLQRIYSPGKIAVAVSPDGYAIVGWTTRVTLRANLLGVATRAPGGAWIATESVDSPATTLSGGSLWTSDFSVAAVRGGEFLLTYARSSVEERNGFVRGRESRALAQSTPGGAWAEDGAISASGEVLADAAGNATLLARQSDGSLTAQRRAPGGDWGSPAVVAPANPVDDNVIAAGVEAPDLAVNAAGEAVATWTRERSAGPVIEFARRPANGDWSAPTALRAGDVPVNSGDGTRVGTPQAVLSGAGRATVVWNSIKLTGRSAVSRIESRDVAANGTLGAVANVSGDLGSTARAGEGGVVPEYRVVAFAGSATASLLTYVRFAGSNVASFAAARRGASGWTPTLTPPAGSTGPSGAVSLGQPSALVLDDLGVATVLWRDGVSALASSLDLTGPTSPAVRVRTTLPLSGRRCPATVAVTAGAARVALPVTDQGSRCGVEGLVPQPPKTRIGTTVLVTVTGSGVWPVVATGRVIGA